MSSLLTNALKRFFDSLLDTIDELVSSKSMVGHPGQYGAIKRSAFAGAIHDLSLNQVSGDFPVPTSPIDNTDVWVHFRIPINTVSINAMFHLQFRGYSQGGGQIIDATAVGYSYLPHNNLINHQVLSTVPAELYRDSNANLVVALKLVDARNTTIVVDTMRVAGGSAFIATPGEVQYSKQDRVAFPAQYPQAMPAALVPEDVVALPTE